jgi:hypothetical protein
MDKNVDAVSEFYKAQGKHDRQMNRLVAKPANKWKVKDFEALKVTRAVRDSAVAALSTKQKLKHVEKLTAEQIDQRTAHASSTASGTEVS